jgi:RnfABCDGE-type electron transport complex G subunit
MNLSSRMILVLTSVGLISGGFLAGVGTLTKERIVINKQKEIENAISLVVPGTSSSQIIYEKDDLAVYKEKDEQGKDIGFALLTSGVGFQDKITLMIGTDMTLTKIRRLTILEQRETPGLGAKITDQEDFLRFWEDKDATQALTLRKPPVESPEDLSPTEVNAITGATISSEKVLGIVNLCMARVKKLKQEGKLSSEGQDAN